MNDHDIPRERDLPPGRLAQLKDELMAHIEQDLERDAEAQQPIPLGRRRRRRAGIAAVAAAVAALGVTGLVTVGGDDPASANTVTRTADGAIVMHIEEGRDPEALEQRLNDLGVPAVVDFLESGCDRARSDGWRMEPTDAVEVTPDMPSGQVLVLPDRLLPRETLAFEFQFDEFEGETASSMLVTSSMTPIGECVPVENGSIVDAEAGIVGG